jgi:glycine C-acetyltransferase/8-amino-7-oxononanoate synthase
MGPDGRGAVAAAGLTDEVDLIVGTLGKALGSYGAFVACDRPMATYLVNSARTFIFSTALPPPAVAAALAALGLLEERPERVARLASGAAALRSALAREGFDTSESRTQILPLIVGEAELAMRICEAALEQGVFAQAIRPPTVPEGTSRLRLAVIATHRPEELRSAARTLADAAREAGFDPRARDLRVVEPDPEEEFDHAPAGDGRPLDHAPADGAWPFDHAPAGGARPFDHEDPALPARPARAA